MREGKKKKKNRRRRRIFQTFRKDFFENRARSNMLAQFCSGVAYTERERGVCIRTGAVGGGSMRVVTGIFSTRAIAVPKTRPQRRVPLARLLGGRGRFACPPPSFELESAKIRRSKVK